MKARPAPGARKAIRPKRMATTPRRTKTHQPAAMRRTSGKRPSRLGGVAWLADIVVTPGGATELRHGGRAAPSIRVSRAAEGQDALPPSPFIQQPHRRGHRHAMQGDGDEDGE